ncbi:hypothetical protein FB446DRAFT_130051 [Lentinula raphanica]|nr:hypothetical protein FB446DRAFT_130051 [Lentinula raphanica]
MALSILTTTRTKWDSVTSVRMGRLKKKSDHGKDYKASRDRNPQLTNRTLGVAYLVCGPVSSGSYLSVLWAHRRLSLVTLMLLFMMPCVLHSLIKSNFLQDRDLGMSRKLDFGDTSSTEIRTSNIPNRYDCTCSELVILYLMFILHPMDRR